MGASEVVTLSIALSGGYYLIDLTMCALESAVLEVEAAYVAWTLSNDTR